MDFLPPLADASEFPAPRFAVRPVLSWGALLPSPSAVTPLPDRATLTSSARSALAVLVKFLELGPGDGVLLPAYHCPALVEPFVASGAAIHFYALQPDLTPQPQHFAAMLAKRPKVALFVSYFGFAPDNREALDSCRKERVTIVHDCAHAMFSVPALGEGEFAVVSVPKFLPAEDGGLLIGSAESGPLQAPPLRTEIRLLSRALDRAFSERRLLPLSALGRIQRCGLRPGSAAAVPTVPKPGTSRYRYFDPATANMRASMLTRWILKTADYGSIAGARRDRYVKIAAALRGTSQGAVLFPELPPDVVPYTVPVVCRTGDEAFRRIRDAGIPLLRWEEIVPSDCETSRYYRAHLLQVPCHQDIADHDLGYLLATLGRILA